MTAHKTAHKNPRALGSGDSCVRSARALADCEASRAADSVGPHRGATETADEADLWWRGNGVSGWACILLGQDWFRPVPVAVADRSVGALGW
jgi:hypothetical protein